ncbi:hypothetical protein COT98_01810 [Candidatus Falkowbacteria bacterium CG10_big_fil_rev_8_21_14_0_10_39_9]|uniref:Uncharacterized protein n=1 Tax=Candidatus Falkowbacteria bacterium CG10_big_fil_rev_8_21_14_0_10_39_9 TaxID=1974566 RepID=A0A2M6WQ73_9BACT|nr:MAG: hypothetical protein COT98_01810 [Candidatus Falkowbacteria bacterium CG10_big_fil_rev_8_21_14_0_10_39_9]
MEERETKVWILDPDELAQKDLAEKISHFSQVRVDTITEAQLNLEAIVAQENFTHVIIDGNEILTEKIRQIFSGIIIVNSKYEEFNDLLIKAGGNYKVRKDQTDDFFLNLVHIPVGLELINATIDFSKSAADPQNIREAEELLLKIKGIIERIRRNDTRKRFEDLAKIFFKLQNLKPVWQNPGHKKFIKTFHELQRKVLSLNATIG